MLEFEEQGFRSQWSLPGAGKGAGNDEECVAFLMRAAAQAAHVHGGAEERFLVASVVTWGAARMVLTVWCHLRCAISPA